MNIKAIIFDVHKTLVDDSGFPRERIWKLLQNSNVQFSFDEYYRLYDHKTKELFNWLNINNFIKIRDIHRKRLCFFYQHFNVTRDIEADLNHLWRSMADCKIYPEVPEVLNTLIDKYKIGLLSNADNDDPLIKILLKQGFQFDIIITSEDMRAYKPQPIMFRQILNELGCQKHEALVVGDSLISDVLGAYNAGIKVAWINRLNKPLSVDYPKPDYEISNLKQLLNIIHI